MAARKDGMRKNVNTTLNVELYKKMKFLALEKDTNLNELLEMAMRLMLFLYKDEKLPPEEEKLLRELLEKKFGEVK